MPSVLKLLKLILLSINNIFSLPSRISITSAVPTTLLKMVISLINLFAGASALTDLLILTVAAPQVIRGLLMVVTNLLTGVNTLSLKQLLPIRIGL